MDTHKIAEGETLASIAKRFSVDMNELAKYNNISNVNRIREGSWLRIPPKKTKQQPQQTPVTPPPIAPAKPPKERSISEVLDDAKHRAEQIIPSWLAELLVRLRAAEADEHVQESKEVPLTPDKTPPAHTPTPAKKPGSVSKKKLSDVKKALMESLGKEPHVLTFAGVRMTENEKRQILASVATCEMNADGFGSINSDQEFVGRKHGKKGIETSYSRIVHIGLSYGIIQYTQDSGMLGELLKCLRDKNRGKFVEIFGGGNAEIADSLITLTTSGRPDLSENASIPISGQAHWDRIRNNSTGHELVLLANTNSASQLPVSREIRGKRVQPIPPSPGATALDIWKGEWRERFLAAGRVLDFQEAQIELGVKKYFNPMLPSARQNNVRAALTLAFLLACNVRGGVGSKLSRLVYRVAKELDIGLPFTNSEDELKCIEAIAHADGAVGDVRIHEDESRRARLLIIDELGFLTEDLYNVSTYA